MEEEKMEYSLLPFLVLKMLQNVVEKNWRLIQQVWTEESAISMI